MLASFMFCVPKLCIIIALIPDIFHVSKKYFISGLETYTLLRIARMCHGYHDVVEN